MPYQSLILPAGKPVVLMGLHVTFDENYTAPVSKRNIIRTDVFAVDLLCYEDLGLLRSLRNDEALKAVTDHLISIGGSYNTQVDRHNSIVHYLSSLHLNSIFILFV